MKKFFVEIGANYFSNLVYLARDEGWNGLVVEPVPEYFNLIERVEGVSYENSIIGTERGNFPFYYVTQETIKRMNLGDWMRGVGSLHKYHTDNARNILSEIVLPMITVADLLEKHKVEKIDYLKIDAEGHDCEILKQFDVDAIDSITFEWRNCNPSEINREMQRLSKSDFSYVIRDDNIIAYRQKAYGTLKCA
jgi:FkbM family methyltransferase